MLKNSNLGALLIILIFLVALVGGYAVRENKWPGLPWSLGFAPTNFVLKFEAPVGQIVNGFPKGLLNIAKDTKITKSAVYDLQKETDKSEVMTTTYRTKAAISELFAAYIERLNDLGYTITRTTSSSGLSNVEAFNKEHSVSVSIYVSSREEKEVRVDVHLPSSSVEKGVVQ